MKDFVLTRSKKKGLKKNCKQQETQNMDSQKAEVFGSSKN